MYFIINIFIENYFSLCFFLGAFIFATLRENIINQYFIKYT